MATETQLAPAAGHGVGKLLAEALLKQPGFVQTLADVAMRGLDARTVPRWDMAAKEWTDAPDYKTQIQTLALLLAHMEGEPIKRIIHQHLGGAGPVDPLAALQASPALRDAARRLLDKSEFRTRNAKPAAPVEDVTVEV